MKSVRSDPTGDQAPQTGAVSRAGQRRTAHFSAPTRLAEVGNAAKIKNIQIKLGDGNRGTEKTRGEIGKPGPRWGRTMGLSLRSLVTFFGAVIGLLYCYVYATKVYTADLLRSLGDLDDHERSNRESEDRISRRVANLRSQCRRKEQVLDRKYCAKSNKTRSLSDKSLLK